MNKRDLPLLSASAIAYGALLAASWRAPTPSLHAVVLVLCSISLAAVLSGTYLAVTDLTNRLPLLRAFRVEASGELPMVYNVHPQVMQALADREPVVVAAQMRAGLNEVILAIAEDRQAREHTDSQLATLAGVGSNLTRLVLGSALLLGGGIIGAIAGLIAAI